MHVVLLRAVNVAGHGLVSMAALRQMAEGLGLTEVKTLLQSGNLVCGAAAKVTADQLEVRLEKASAKGLGVTPAFFVRSAKEWLSLIASNPFPKEAAKDPGHLVAMVLKAAPKKAAVEALKAAIKGKERVVAGGRHLYITYPDGIGRSKLTNAMIEKMLGMQGTARNWNTVMKLAQAVGPEPVKSSAKKAKS